MAMCKFCGKPFAWGYNEAEGRYIPLVPVDEHEGLDRNFQDENGVLRADHRTVCLMRGGPTVRVARLAKSVKAKEIIGTWSTPDPDTGEIVHEEIIRTGE
jgi:hypothetical protein